MPKMTSMEKLLEVMKDRQLDLEKLVENLADRVRDLEETNIKQLKANHALVDKVVEMAKALKNHQHLIG